MATVHNLSTGATQSYTCTPREAVIAAYAQAQGDMNTWEYREKYDAQVQETRRSFYLGDFAAFKEDPPRATFADSTKYKIVRGFQNSDRKYTIHRGLTLEEALAHCLDPKTSSQTCTSAAGKARTRKLGAWFDGYEKE